MGEACLNSRDRAPVALASVLIHVNITDHTYGKKITLDGKTERRTPVIVPSEHGSGSGSTIARTTRCL